MKKLFALLCAVTLIALIPFQADAAAITLNVYNWGEYISDGSEGSLNVNREFEKYYLKTYGERVKVNYTTYASNEDMYNKLKTGATSYDIVIPSDYMIERMIREDMLRPLNFDNIPNYKYIAPQFRGLFYDPAEKYSVPYTYGMVGIIYNTKMVDEKDADGWDLLWNEKYKGGILQFNNPRDAFGTAMYRRGIDVNTSDHALLDRAAMDLIEQKPLIQSYVMDEIFNKMKSGSAAVAAYYAGDFLSMYEDNEDLAFYYPEEGTNVFVDAACVPTAAAHPEIAERYIDFLMREEIAVANAEYIYYASPHLLVTENEDYIEYMTDIHEDAMDILYPDEGKHKTSYYQNLSADTLAYSNALWENLKLANSIEPWIYVVSIAIVAGVLLLLLWKLISKTRREKYY